MNVTITLERSELQGLLCDSGLWRTAEEVAEAVPYRYRYEVLTRDEGGTIDAAIASFYLDDLGYIDRVPKHWQEYIDREKYGRDIRLKDAHGRALYEVPHPSGRGTDWRFYVIRWNPNL